MLKLLQLYHVYLNSLFLTEKSALDFNRMQSLPIMRPSLSARQSLWSGFPYYGVFE
jgi:hypothetical protein